MTHVLAVPPWVDSSDKPPSQSWFRSCPQSSHSTMSPGSQISLSDHGHNCMSIVL
jgi:hypothetical protein